MPLASATSAVGLGDGLAATAVWGQWSRLVNTSFAAPSWRGSVNCRPCLGRGALLSTSRACLRGRRGVGSSPVAALRSLRACVVFTTVHPPAQKPPPIYHHEGLDFQHPELCVDGAPACDRLVPACPSAAAASPHFNRRLFTDFLTHIQGHGQEGAQLRTRDGSR